MKADIEITHNEFPWWVEVVPKPPHYRCTEAVMDRYDAIVEWLDATFEPHGWSAPDADIFGSSEWRFQFRAEEHAKAFEAFILSI